MWRHYFTNGHCSNGFSNYAWSNGNETPVANFTQPGNYSATVGQHYVSLLCETTQSFNVLASNVATIVEVETIDFNGNNNVISINVVGFGDYEYSLEGLNYQDSNVFYWLITLANIVFLLGIKMAVELL